MTRVVTIELGPKFLGQALKIDGELVCALPPAALKEAPIQAGVRELMETQGMDCRKCLGCPVGTAQ